jgi:hypothetical protein
LSYESDAFASDGFASVFAAGSLFGLSSLLAVLGSPSFPAPFREARP